MKTLLFVLLSAGLAFAQSRAPSSCPIVAQRVAVNATSNGDNTIIASSNKRIVVWQWFLVNSHATQDENLTIKEGSTAISGAYLLKAAGGSHTAPCTGTPWAIVPLGSAFVINESAAGSIQGTVYYTLENP
jgi:hypothetical protein